MSSHYGTVLLDPGEYGFPSGGSVLLLNDPSAENPRHCFQRFRQSSSEVVLPISLHISPEEYGVLDDKIQVHFNPEEFGFWEKYEVDGELLGDGFATLVKLGVNKKTGEKVAIKIIDKTQLYSEAERQSALREILIHKNLAHHHIVKVKETNEDDGKHYIVLEFAEGGTLWDKMKNNNVLPEDTCKSITRQLLSALDHIHDRNIVHCDIKPHNILLMHEFTPPPVKYFSASASNTPVATPSSHTLAPPPPMPSSGGTPCSSISPARRFTLAPGDPRIKLCDFGLAQIIAPDCSHVPFTEVCGTSGYIAPEMIKHEQYNCALDMWSVGIILYQMLVGFEPFYPPSKVEPQVPFPERYWRGISPHARDLLSSLLKINPADRISAKMALAHPWFYSPAS